MQATTYNICQSLVSTPNAIGAAHGHKCTYTKMVVFSFLTYDGYIAAVKQLCQLGADATHIRYHERAAKSAWKHVLQVYYPNTVYYLTQVKA